jgi:LysR family glycine cleavage system transcriptional activator
MGPLASPEFLRGHDLQRPVDIAYVPLIHDDSLRRAGRPLTWSEWLRTAGAPALDVHRGLRFDDSHLALQARREGKGSPWAGSPTLFTTWSQGRLVLPFRKVMPLDLHYHLLVPESRVDEPLIAAFRGLADTRSREFRSLLSRHGAVAQAA